jgi:hypothetical protein
VKPQDLYPSNQSSQILPGDWIVLVSGLPRSGTSMMMKMLEAGGISVLTDNLRQADEDNPKGNFELEKVKSWLQNQSNFEVFTTNYNDILAKPQSIIEQLVDFLDLDLDKKAMQKVVDTSLYRQRSQE